MAPKDKKKMAFIIERGLYYYKMILFSLKNTGATYQRFINKLQAPNWIEYESLC